MPVLIVYDNRGILVTVGKIYISWFFIQHITICCAHLFDIVFSNRKVRYFCNTVCISSHGCHQLVLSIIIRAYTIGCFDILCSVNLKGNV